MDKKKLKLPTWKELKFNIKKTLIELNPKTFNEWKEKYQFQFLFNLKCWLSKSNIDYLLIPEYYNVLFYWSFINYRREEEIINILKTKGFKVKRSNLKQDAILKIDLFASSIDKNYIIQIKNQVSNFSELEKDKLIEYSKKHNTIPLLITKTNYKYSCTNLLTNKKLNILEYTKKAKF